MDTASSPDTFLPALRVNAVNDAPFRPDGDYILYWMIAQRRVHWNFALDRALELGQRFNKPVLIFEALRVGYPWASDRIHQFVLEGMVDNRRACEAANLSYYAYVEEHHGQGRGLLAALSQSACAVVTDEFPCFFLPSMVSAAGAKLGVRLEQVDGNGLLPLHSVHCDFPTAFSFRRHLHEVLPEFLGDAPSATPLTDYRGGRAAIPTEIAKRWPCSDPEAIDLAALPIDHSVTPVAATRGGHVAATKRMRTFIEALPRYGPRRSRLASALHFGHVGPHQLFRALADAQDWTPANLSPKTTGQRAGWWGMSQPAEAFIDQFVTWRELGYAFSFRNPGTYTTFESLPDWARKTLTEHANDTRPHCYGLETLEAAQTHDEVWNAAQQELVHDGRIHNTLRMLWGKKVLEWAPSPQLALEWLIHLNNKYALDGRNPNSYSGIFWILGRFDRPFVERPIYGTVRYMSSDRTLKKISATDMPHYRPSEPRQASFSW